MDIDYIYKQLTNIDIKKQQLLWDDRGKGYYGEFLVFCELYQHISGNCKILMNLNIPTENEKTTEVDLVLIHETGIYVFEIKHYKGTIYGDDTSNIWTQYFRTAKNNTFKNPILQNEYHIKALRNIFNSVPVKSVIVFTNNDCDIKVKNYNNNVSLCTLQNMNKTLYQSFENSIITLSMAEIDNIFDKLSKYSQMQEIILYNGKEESFISWLQPIIQSLDEEKKKLDNQIQRNKKNAFKVNIINFFVVVVCLLLSITFINIARVNYNNELKKFKQNFKHVDEIDDKYITLINKYFSVSDVVMNELSNNSVIFTAKISAANDMYGMNLTKDSKYIVMSSNGKVYEYNVFGKSLNYNRYSNTIGKGIRSSGYLSRAEFQKISLNEIEYIKITGIELFKLNISRTIIREDLELELYYKS